MNNLTMSQRTLNPVTAAGCLTALLLLASCRDQPAAPFNREEALRSFELMEGFQIEVVAHEPLIADPVAMEIDESGRMYVIEMHGYPLDKSGSGSVKLLSDEDGDGVMDKSVVFTDKLVLPNGVMRWKKGILVTDAPHVFYFEDTDGDGRADVKDTLLTGFALSNPQHKVSTPKYGLDNWIYVANEPATASKLYMDEFGDTGTEIRFPGAAGSAVLPPNANGRSVRFRPDRHQLEMLSSATQYSNAQDVWGRQFFGNNTNHLYHEVIQARYLARNPHLAVANATHTLSGYGMPADVYPITENAEHQIFTDVGVFTSACGINLYGGGLFPEQFDHVAFVAEPVSNLVHAATLKGDGASFKAGRLLEKKEFLASRDAWFRPVNHYIGPDGALYVVDYHRRYIEHPEWMADDIVKSGALYDGKDKGRIYRITPVGTPGPEWTKGLQLEKSGNEELVRYLSHKNVWYRKNAQRLLVDRQERSVVDQLAALATENSQPLGQLHAAWTLEGLNALTPATVAALLDSRVPELRENGIVLSELLGGEHAEITKALLALREDPDPRVRFQLLCTLGALDTPEAREARMKLLFGDIRDSWMQIAALSAKAPDYESLLKEAIRRYSSTDDACHRLIERLTSMPGETGSHDQIRSLIAEAIGARDRHAGGWQSAILTGLARNKATDFRHEDYNSTRDILVKAASGHPYPAVQEASLNLLRITGLPKGGPTEKVLAASKGILENPSAKTEDRLHALAFLSINPDQALRPVFYRLLTPKEPVGLQKAALKVLGEMSGTEIADYLTDNWQQLSPQLRDAAIGLFLAGEERTRILIKALENNVIDPSSLDFYRQIYLMTLANDTLRKKARVIFKDESKTEERKKAIASYSGALSGKGNAENGQQVFARNCSVCHQIGGNYGTAFGPDLGTIRNRRPESLLTDILDPSLSIADGFDLWELKLTNGESRQGIISTETPTTIALSIYGSAPEIISRQDIESMRALGVTIMPAGLETAIPVQEMADLLAFLKQP
ncbi:c-type cytochrome [Ravibacter arvi]|uniref:C-type cytochrome n=2 Tax=Ravibacter arvi TaxID=2051041 RepID=A0ABP8M075_9BACT